MGTVTAKAEETRARIMAEAVRHFRTLGYTKTTVADIAKACGMSPGNVYRFFDSKASINEAIARVMLAEVEERAEEILARSQPAAERLRGFLVEVHEMTRERYVDQSQVHEMVAAAISERWHVIEDHLRHMRAMLQRIIEDGVQSGEFRPVDAATTARCAHSAMGKFFHPILVAECIAEDLRTQASEMADFILQALQAGITLPDIEPPCETVRQRLDKAGT